MNQTKNAGAARWGSGLLDCLVCVDTVVATLLRRRVLGEVKRRRLQTTLTVDVSKNASLFGPFVYALLQ